MAGPWTISIHQVLSSVSGSRCSASRTPSSVAPIVIRSASACSYRGKMSFFFFIVSNEEGKILGNHAELRFVTHVFFFPHNFMVDFVDQPLPEWTN